MFRLALYVNSLTFLKSFFHHQTKIIKMLNLHISVNFIRNHSNFQARSLLDSMYEFIGDWFVVRTILLLKRVGCVNAIVCLHCRHRHSCLNAWISQWYNGSAACCRHCDRQWCIISCSGAGSGRVVYLRGPYYGSQQTGEDQLKRNIRVNHCTPASYFIISLYFTTFCIVLL